VEREERKRERRGEGDRKVKGGKIKRRKGNGRYRPPFRKFLDPPLQPVLE